jgi:hypothetical protein
MAADFRLDDGRRVYVVFPRGIVQGEMPPIFVIGSEGETADRQQPHSPEHPDRRSPVRRGRAAPWQRQAAADRQDRSHRRKGLPSPPADRGATVMSEEATTNPTPMRLRAEPPRVTRLSRKMLAGVGAVALLGIGGALIYALQTRDMSGPGGEELYSTENRATADGLAGLPKDYTGPVLGPALPGDLGGPILARRTGVSPSRRPPWRRLPVDPAESAALPRKKPHVSAPCSSSRAQEWRRRLAQICRALPALTLVASPATQDRITRAFLNGPVDRQTVAADRDHGASLALHPSGRGGDPGRAHHRHPLRSSRPDHRAGDGECL